MSKRLGVRMTKTFKQARLPEDLMKTVRVFMGDPELTAEQHAIQSELVNFNRWHKRKVECDEA